MFLGLNAFVFPVFLCFYHVFVQHANLEINHLQTFLSDPVHKQISRVLLK